MLDRIHIRESDVYAEFYERKGIEVKLDRLALYDPVTLLNASLTLSSDDDKWRIVLGGNNVTDEVYPVAGTSSMTTASGYAEIIYARPVSVSLNVTRKF